MKPLFALCALAFSLAVVSCSSRDGAPPPPITSAGTHECFNGRVVVTVTEATNGAVNFRIKAGESTIGPSRSTIRKGQPWFIYVSSSTNAWVFDGRKELSLYELRPTGSRMTSSQRVPDLIRAAPEAVRERLPQELKGI